MTYQLIRGDCLLEMPKLPAQSIDMILTDLPYGTTACKWDSIIPFEPLWTAYKYIAKPHAAIVLFGSQPFTSALVMSNPTWFKYCWVWDKITARGHLVAKIRPMQQSEDICVFGNGRISYYPIMELRDKPIVGKEGKRTEIMGGESMGYTKVYTHMYPKTILRIPTETGLHPTQKPIALLEYLIKTYTNPDDVVLDSCFGSCSTGIACLNTGRNFIGIEKDEQYFAVGSQRMQERATQLALNPPLFENYDH